MSLNPESLDRYITGNYGEDQFPDDWECPGHDLKFIGRDDGTLVYQCRNCSDLFDHNDCRHPMRDGPCEMDLGHRGRHTTVAFYCDICGKMRRGQGQALRQRMSDGYYEDVGTACFMCLHVTNR